ncbi:MAG: RDD family protein, partial [Chloroflexi bacterium]|nr:RDD family protein [Chloroflexota bacterium]
QAIVRYIGYYINTAFLLLGWIWAIFDDHGEGWHDKLAGTRVEKA